MSAHPTALIADDEPLLRDALRRQLATVWPELEIVAEARNGREAMRLFEERHPDICFLDVHMPGLSGVEAANGVGTGLTTLRERLQLIFGDGAHLRLTNNARGGAIVEVDMPAHT